MRPVHTSKLFSPYNVRKACSFRPSLNPIAVPKSILNSSPLPPHLHTHNPIQQTRTNSTKMAAQEQNQRFTLDNVFNVKDKGTPTTYPYTFYP